MEMNRTGFALTELIVVMVIMGIVLSIATLSFNSMQRKAKIEAETREVFGDLNEARLNSIYLKKRHRITFQPTSYVMNRYSSDNDANGTQLFSKNVPYQLSKASGASIADIFFEFDIRGFSTNTNTIYVNPANSGAMFDCIVISQSRTNMGLGVDSDNNGQAENCNAK
jgi:prepilin-type N-terminal cleavage/methylation domain-containing protein